MEASSKTASNRTARSSGLLRAMMISTLFIAGGTTVTAVQAVAQTGTQTTSFAVPAGPLGQALVLWGRQSGVQISYLDAVTAGKTTAGLSGNLSPEQALARLLSGTGLHYSFADGRSSVTIMGIDPPKGTVAPQGGLLLDTVIIPVDGHSNAARVYSTAGAVAHIPREALENFQITSPADILRGTTGVLSGESRNSGSLNVNIHGMQGQGRVAVTVDGSENAALVSQGYQGVADRSFVDPDFISSVDINKNGDAERGAIGGSVAISTIGVDDILREGQNVGGRLKLSAWGNTTDQEYLRQSAWSGSAYSGFTRGESSDRPSLLNPTAGSASLSFGLRTDRVDVVAGYSRRNAGNYHAGTNGRDARNVDLGPGQRTKYDNGGLSTYFGGEEVMNTSNETGSGLVKVTIRATDDLTWNLGHSRYDSTFGEVMASRQANGWIPGQQGALSETKLATTTSRLRYKPADNPLIDISWNLWRTDLDSASAANFQFMNESYLTTNKIIGTDLSNTSRFTTAWGDMTLTFGGAWKSEETAPVGDNPFALARDGKRTETSVFAKADWAVTDQLTVKGGLRYMRYKSRDNSTGHLSRDHDVSDEATGGSLGVAWQATDRMMVYANYQSLSRLPSLFETVSMGASYYSPIKPERSRNLDIGMNFEAGDVWAAGDNLAFKLGYFDKRIDDYIVRQAYGNPFRLLFTNIDSARFNGLDFSSTYANNGFAATFSATYYTGIEFCRDGNSCGNHTLSGDYSTNQIPPEYQLALDVSQRLLEDRLVLGGRLNRVGPRAAGAEDTITGATAIIAPIEWDPYTTVDLYARYQVNEDLDLAFDVTNVTDKYYVDPLAQAQIPAPGRTARISLDWRF